MYLFSVSNGKECRNEARALLGKYKEDTTSLGRYVTSVLESAFAHSNEE